MPLIFLGDQIVVGERFIGRIAPELAAHALMHALGKGFGQTVGQRAQQDGGVIVLVGLEALDVFFFAEAGGDGKAADIIGAGRLLAAPRNRPAPDWGGRPRAPSAGAACASVVSTSCAAVIGVEDDIVALGRSRPEADDALRGQPLLVDDLLQHRLRILEQAARRLADFVVIENLPDRDRPVPRCGRTASSRYTRPARPDRRDRIP